MRLLLLLTAFCIKVYSQQRSSAQPTPFYESRTLQQSSATVPQQATVSRQYPSIAPPVTAYHTAAAGVPAATNIQQHQTQQQRTRNPYPTQMSYRAPQRKSTPRGHAQSNHVPILTKASPTRIGNIVLVIFCGSVMRSDRLARGACPAAATEGGTREKKSRGSA
uniref:Uncharacterized protein n=1 Tax=Pristionchus pacificus TaxID=54126 RepID=A0A454XQF5_PRIPA|eukprot:PDM81484.1 hypothetical protein PRIPAC_35360 [Pristionchus pacificus]